MLRKKKQRKENGSIKMVFDIVVGWATDWDMAEKIIDRSIEKVKGKYEDAELNIRISI